MAKNILEIFENSLKNQYIKLFVRDQTIVNLKTHEETTTTYEFFAPPKDYKEVKYCLITDVSIEFASNGCETLDNLSITLILDNGTHLLLDDEDYIELFPKKPE